MAARPPLVVDPGPLHLRRGRRRLAALVQGHRRAQHGDASTASTRRRTAAASRSGRSRRATARRGDTDRASTCCAAEVRSPQLRRRPHPDASRSSTTTTGSSTTGCAPTAHTTTPPAGTWPGTPWAGLPSAGHGQVVVTTPRSTLAVPDGCGDVGIGPAGSQPEYGVRHAAPVVSSLEPATAPTPTSSRALVPGDEVRAVDRRGASGGGLVVEVDGDLGRVAPAADGDRGVRRGREARA